MAFGPDIALTPTLLVHDSGALTYCGPLSWDGDDDGVMMAFGLE